MPPELHAELQESAEVNGRSMNAEILARLQENHATRLLRENAEIKTMLREMLDMMREKF